ncbi:MAG: class I SAM-dependent methyltransferase [Neisseriaceae bacterium]|nr:class I SAM-dependent methyltransferase [Neisseriaceae bacterium]
MFDLFSSQDISGSLKENNALNIAELGQVFTPQSIVATMLSLRQNSGSVLEPSCGDGAFLNNIKNAVGIEIDQKFQQTNIINIDFFDYSLDNKFDTIIGNPPYVRYQDILSKTKQKLKPYSSLFDKRTNLYLFFIYKAILHLKNNGELIFITPRDFLKSTSAIKLNEFIYQQGTITDFIDLGDEKIFKDAQPNCAIWRFEKNNFKRNTNIVKEFSCVNGQLLFTDNQYTVKFSDLFFVKVGAVSGCDEIFVNEEFGNLDFVYSKTAQTGKTRKMIYNQNIPYLLPFKDKLIKRKIRNFNEQNWYCWGRDYYKSNLPRIYVNTKTRNKKPFFTHSCTNYDGSVLAIFPKFDCTPQTLNQIIDELNNVHWQELGFICDGRFLFSQKSLENCVLPKIFYSFLVSNRFQAA